MVVIRWQSSEHINRPTRWLGIFLSKSVTKTSISRLGYTDAVKSELLFLFLVYQIPGFAAH